MVRQDFVNEVFKKLEENHIYLYHDITKQEFEKQKQNFLENVDNMDEVHFQGGMLKLFALFKEAHLFYSTKMFKRVYADFYNIGKDYFLKNDGIYKKITKVNGIDIEEVVEKLKALVPYEVDTWAYHRIKGLICSPVALKMVDCGESDDEILFDCGGKKIITSTLSCIQKKEKQKDIAKDKWYDFKVLDSGKILYVRYSVCSDMKDCPFSEFVADMVKSLDKKPKACIVDVRSNSGGSSYIVLPLLNIFKKTKSRLMG